MTVRFAHKTILQEIGQSQIDYKKNHVVHMTI